MNLNIKQIELILITRISRKFKFIIIQLLNYSIKYTHLT